MYSPNDSNRDSNSCANLHRDRFELLSAYIDHEVTADERRQVEAWIAEDPNFAKMHRRMTQLQFGFQQLPAVAPSEHVDVMIAQVLKKVDRPRPNWQVLTGIGGAIAAAVTVAVLSNLPKPGFAPEMAAVQPNTTAAGQVGQVQMPAPSTLMISLDEPIYVATKGVVADEAKPAQ
jgi:anti-sigma factor RsiW